MRAEQKSATAGLSRVYCIPDPSAGGGVAALRSRASGPRLKASADIGTSRMPELRRGCLLGSERCDPCARQATGAGAERQSPGADHLGDYSGAYNYLKAVAAVGVARAKADGRAVIAQLKSSPFDDAMLGHCVVRQDGRMVHDMRLMEIKKPAIRTANSTSRG